MLWRIERSDDRVTWKEARVFFWSELAQAAFDLELSLRKAKHVRLRSPDGKIHEQACPGKLPEQT